MLIKRILVPVDFSPRSRQALRYAVEFARSSQAEIIALHVVPPPSRARVATLAYLHQPLPHAPRSRVAHAQVELGAMVSSIDHQGIAIDERIEAGDPTATTVQVATEERSDLIILGTRGRHGVADFLLGSVAKSLVDCAPCPVLTLHPSAPTLL